MLQEEKAALSEKSEQLDASDSRQRGKIIELKDDHRKLNEKLLEVSGKVEESTSLSTHQKGMIEKLHENLRTSRSCQAQLLRNLTALSIVVQQLAVCASERQGVIANLECDIQRSGSCISQLRGDYALLETENRELGSQLAAAI